MECSRCSNSSPVLVNFSCTIEGPVGAATRDRVERQRTVVSAIIADASVSDLCVASSDVQWAEDSLDGCRSQRASVLSMPKRSPGRGRVVLDVARAPRSSALRANTFLNAAAACA
jgi:hypothetical protein